jgi:hypothetical protein
MAAARPVSSHWRARPAGADEGDVVMTIHAPAHPGGVVAPHAQHHYLAWLVAVVAVVLAVGALLVVPGIVPGTATPMTAEQASLIGFRAAERADWAASEAYPEWKALLEFRAAEREGR